MRFTSGPQLQRQLSYTKCLISDVVSNAQNRALKKLKMDSNSRYNDSHIMKCDEKDIANYRPNWLLTLDYKTYTAHSSESNAKKILVTIIGEHEPEVIKNITLLYTD